MASTRLTKDMRNVILSRLMKHAFDDREKQLKVDEHALGDDVYGDLYPARLLKKMRALPDGFLRKSSGLRVCFGGQRVNVSFGATRLIAEAHDTYEGVKSYDASDDLSVRHLELDGRRRALDEDEGRAKSAAKAALDSCTTVKNLLEVWPEAEPFVRDFTTSRAVVALTVSVDELNNQFGL